MTIIWDRMWERRKAKNIIKTGKLINDGDDNKKKKIKCDESEYHTYIHTYKA